MPVTARAHRLDVEVGALFAGEPDDLLLAGESVVELLRLPGEELLAVRVSDQQRRRGDGRKPPRRRPPAAGPTRPAHAPRGAPSCPDARRGDRRAADRGPAARARRAAARAGAGRAAHQGLGQPHTHRADRRRSGRAGPDQPADRRAALPVTRTVPVGQPTAALAREHPQPGVGQLGSASLIARHLFTAVNRGRDRVGPGPPAGPPRPGAGRPSSRGPVPTAAGR
jgi:hypothetical protein